MTKFKHIIVSWHINVFRRFHPLRIALLFSMLPRMGPMYGIAERKSENRNQIGNALFRFSKIFSRIVVLKVLPIRLAVSEANLR